MCPKCKNMIFLKTFLTMECSGAELLFKKLMKHNKLNLTLITDVEIWKKTNVDRINLLLNQLFYIIIHIHYEWVIMKQIFYFNSLVSINMFSLLFSLLWNDCIFVKLIRRAN